MNEEKRRAVIIEQLKRPDPDPANEYPDLDAIDPWEALGLPLGPYNTAVESDVLMVLEGVIAKKYVSDIAAEAGLTESHAELIQYMLCASDVCEYGTSPRGCWIIHSMEKEVAELAKRWRQILTVQS